MAPAGYEVKFFAGGKSAHHWKEQAPALVQIGRDLPTLTAALEGKFGSPHDDLDPVLV